MWSTARRGLAATHRSPSGAPNLPAAPRRGDAGRPATCHPTLGQVCEIRQCDGQTGLPDDRKELVARPNHKGRPPIGPLEGSAFVAACLLEVLSSGSIPRAPGGDSSASSIRQLDQQRRAAVEPPPFGKGDTSVVDLARFQFRLLPAAAAGPLAGVFGDPAFLDGEERQMEIAVGPVRRGDEHGRHCAMRPGPAASCAVGNEGLMRACLTAAQRVTSGHRPPTTDHSPRATFHRI